MELPNPSPGRVLDRDLLDKLYYFSLRKTGDRHTAEELVQDIACEALVSLAHGCEPDAFAPWIWGVAHNRYAQWVRRQQRMLSRSSGRCISDHADIESDAPSPETLALDAEQAALLRREIALLAREHREMVVAYYVEGKRVADIGRAMGLPEGTVKRKLHESRQRIREGMQMARTGGQRSYAPENVGFSMSGSSGKDGSPWSLIGRAIPKNILLEAYNNPCTIEELSLTLGIAAPYMEEEASLLTQGTLLRRSDDGRLQTDLVILSKEA